MARSTTHRTSISRALERSAPRTAPEQEVRTPQIPAEAVAVRAYARFLARGGEHGFDSEDWLEAERELTAEARRA